MNILILKVKIKKYSFEIILSLLLIVNTILFFFVEELITIISYAVSILIIISKSVKAKKMTKPQKIMISEITEILESIHALQNVQEMNNNIEKKIKNLKNNYQKYLEEIGVFIEEIDEEYILKLYIDDKKIIAKPGSRIKVESNVKYRFIKSHEDLMNELEKIGV